jgi:pimeloyl-ACP methyl ester carboxylesterase
MADGEGRGPTARTFARRARRVVLIAVSALLVSVLALLGVLLLWSPGRPTPFLDARGKPLPGSISEKIHVNINGVEQGMFIKGKDSGNPVLLYLHGGMPDYFLTQDYPTGLDEYFTMVWWEQRGSGLSYSPGIPPESVNPDQLVSDTLSVTNYLRSRFGQQKIYLMGHSGGTFIGIQAAARAPELYSAYIGVAQMSHQLESEELAYAYMLRRFKDDGNAKMVRKLEEAPVTDSVPLPDSYLSVRDSAMHSLGIGTTHDMRSVVTGLLLRSFENREYTLSEKTNMWRGKIFSGSRLWNTQLSTDLTEKVTRLEIPVYFFHGVYDYTVSYPLAKSYYEQLDAPLKGFYTFTESAHSPLFEEPKRMREIMQADVLTGARGLADPWSGSSADLIVMSEARAGIDNGYWARDVERGSGITPTRPRASPEPVAGQRRRVRSVPGSLWCRVLT